MSERREKLRNTIIQLIIWCIAAPILAVWALLSLLPIVSVIRAWGSTGDVLIALAFLATGALGLAAAAIAYRLMLWERTTLPITTTESRTRRVIALSAYALVWMSLYAL